MAKSKQGDQVEQKEEPKVGAPVQAAANEFAPTVINDGGENGAREVAPAKLEEKAPPVVDDPQTVENDAEGEVTVDEQDFLEYVQSVLAPEAKKLGYEVVLNKVVDEDALDFQGPTARYSLDTGEMRVFQSKREVPVGYVPYEEYLAKKAE